MTHPQHVINEACGLGEKGLNATEIARRLGVPRGTVRDWLAGRTPSRPGACCEVCGGARHDPWALPESYMYLLGLYLGDGCISSHPRGVHRLRIVLDLRYPGIIEECQAAIEQVVPNNKVSQQLQRSGYADKPTYSSVEVHAYSKTWPCLFPQHGPGRKHERKIELVDWQRDLLERDPRPLLRGLIHSDGCRFMNTGRGGWRWPRYAFNNRSADILEIFVAACDVLGVHSTCDPRTVYVSRKEDVARLDEFIGPKA